MGLQVLDVGVIGWCTDGSGFELWVHGVRSQPKGPFSDRRGLTVVQVPGLGLEGAQKRKTYSVSPKSPDRVALYPCFRVEGSRFPEGAQSINPLSLSLSVDGARLTYVGSRASLGRSRV